MANIVTENDTIPYGSTAFILSTVACALGPAVLRADVSFIGLLGPQIGQGLISSHVDSILLAID